ncbi:PREDICTED: ubiquitin carboxyl-terminal hydrolase 47-like [Amphimedon queenslandica]|uniref:Ubiquitin-like domain-containing protein n=1 Tax=Amphimedon queenslandica TaxID=400682 RepID=A0AAN0JR31_AMPQE|nr:PREDICTED: ubiquitin carboxyl-terminal hydrolase 47-like [Amphimedon queenslandica]|eukprot:XP_019859520.1 PREDICTED: ubiquitin carboxyl-terminal hydrolase 47-like [Amphimedon queenslandica]
MKIEYLRSLTSNTDSAASRVIRGMTFEIDDCKFHLEAMTRSDYQPLVDNKKLIEKLQERITLMNIELMTEREHNEKIIKDMKDHLKKIEEKRQRKKKQKTEEEMCTIYLCCNHPVTGELINSFLEVHKDELLPSLMNLAPHVPIERCRLVKYDYRNKVMEQSFDLDEYQHQTIGQIMSVADYRYSFALFLETRKENETFKKYNEQGINLKVSMVDLSAGEVGLAKPMRGEEGWTVEELKQHIGEVFNINPSCMRIVKEKYTGISDVSDVGGTLKEILNKRDKSYTQLLYVLSDLKDYQKEFKDKMQVQVSSSITLAQLKEELAPLIGVPPTGFRVYRISDNEEYEIEELEKTLKYMYIESGPKLRVKLGRALRRGEYRVKLYLLQVNNTEV